VPQRAQRPADKMGAQAGFHADDARRQLLEDISETQAPDLPSEGDLPIGAQSDEVKNLLTNVDANDRQGRRVGLHLGFIAASPVHQGQPEG
jgi:hypothetical protein